MKSYLKILFLSLIISATFICAVGCGGDIDVPDESKDAETEATDEATDESDSDESASAECAHVYEGEKVLLAATCTKEGILKKTCTACGKSISENIPKTAHTEVEDKGKAATCTESGMTDGKHCSVCNTVTVEQKPIAALGHKEVVDEAVEATCSVPGKTAGKHCGVCETVLVAQTPITAEHTTIKRTWHPVTCKENGAVELYCTKCNTVREYETILAGHYSADHEYAQIEGLCTSFKHGDKCNICNTRFIAPGTYTVMGTITKSHNIHMEILDKWTGKERFSFDYKIGDKTYSAQSFGIAKEDTEYFIEIDGEKLEALDSLVIIITEEYLAEVSDDFYNEVFLKYFEKGEYALSGKYVWLKDITVFIDIEQDINFTYTPKNSTSTKGTKIIVVERVNEPIVVKSVIRYDTYYQPAISWESDPKTEWSYNVKREIDFGAESQTVSKEFFEWFTKVAEKQVA